MFENKNTKKSNFSLILKINLNLIFFYLCELSLIFFILLNFLPPHWLSNYQRCEIITSKLINSTDLDYFWEKTIVLFYLLILFNFKSPITIYSCVVNLNYSSACKTILVWFLFGFPYKDYVFSLVFLVNSWRR
jgi:hypothetical protein